ncbi:MAG: methylenetetrahydrofolate reductase [Syntrophomonadaceae bacterium]|jgi:methylenetetrahydrofolate reductase (NADPH)|nr:methylenetetrahydrofolate reductase [Syntrophomonadaceae bacterium]
MARSNLERVLEQGHFAVTAEVGPPKSCNADFVRRKARMLKGYADAFNVTDNQTAIVRMSSIAAAHLLQSEGLEAVVQMTCRDRNRIALQSDVLGAAALGLRNLLCLTGDHQSFGNHPQAKNVFDLDSVQLVAAVRAMRDQGRFLCGEEMKVRPELFIGCVENPFADPFPARVARLAKKVAAGAEFVQTQCVLDIPRFRQFMQMVVDAGLHEKVAVLAGVMPIKSARMARYMQHNVAGMMVSDDVVARLEGASDVEAEAIALVVEQIQEIREIPGVRGIHIMAVAWEEKVPDIVTRAGLFPRPATDRD